MPPTSQIEKQRELTVLAVSTFCIRDFLNQIDPNFEAEHCDSEIENRLQRAIKTLMRDFDDLRSAVLVLRQLRDAGKNCALNPRRPLTDSEVAVLNRGLRGEAPHCGIIADGQPAVARESK